MHCCFISSVFLIDILIYTHLNVLVSYAFISLIKFFLETVYDCLCPELAARGRVVQWAFPYVLCVSRWTQRRAASWQ